MSDPVRERLDSLRVRLILSSVITTFQYHQEEMAGNVGYFRVRCTLTDGSELQLVERFRNVANAISIEKYSFHWQCSDGILNGWPDGLAWLARSVRTEGIKKYHRS